MKIEYKIGKKTFEEDYFPKEKMGDAISTEEYLYDAALQLEMSKAQRLNESWFEEDYRNREDGILGHRFLFSEEAKVGNEISSTSIRVRFENLIRSYVIASECISGLKNLLEHLYESQNEALHTYGTLEGNTQIGLDEFRQYIFDFLNRVETLLSEKNSLAHPLTNWDAQMPYFQNIPYVPVEKVNGIIGNIHAMIRGEYDHLEKYRGKINNNFRKQYIRNQLSALQNVFTANVFMEAVLLKLAKTAVWGRSVSLIDNIKMVINPNELEQNRDRIEELFMQKINESAECPHSYEEIADDEDYVRLIRKLEDNVHELIRLTKNNKSGGYFDNKKCCVAVFNLNDTTRLFSLSGASDFSRTNNGDHTSWPPADKVYSVLSEDTAHSYVWCRLTPEVRRYKHKESDGRVHPLETGINYETLGSLTAAQEVPRELKADFSCCERKIFAHFENDLSQCDKNTSMTTRWAPCELCIPAINDLYNNGNIYIDCYYIWDDKENYVKYLNECLGEDRQSRERREA